MKKTPCSASLSVMAALHLLGKFSDDECPAGSLSHHLISGRLSISFHKRMACVKFDPSAFRVLALHACIDNLGLAVFQVEKQTVTNRP